MGTLTMIFFFGVGVYSAVLVLCCLADLNASKLASADLRPELNAVMMNGGPNEMLALCESVGNSALGRAVKTVAATLDQAGSPAAARAETLKLLFDTAHAREEEMASRTT